MKKIGMFFVFAFLAFSLVGAAEMDAKDGTGVINDEVIAAGGQDGNPPPHAGETGAKMIFPNSEFVNEKGQKTMIQGEGKQMKLQVGEYTANCENCNLTQDRLQIHAQLSNGNRAEIKVMPDVASEKALQRLQLKNCSGECSIELKEVGSGEGAKMAYSVKTKTKAKFLGMFNTNVDAEVQIDAETGEVLRTKKPWWAVLQTTEEEVIEAQ